MRNCLVSVATAVANRILHFTTVPSHRLERLMKHCIMSVLLVVLIAAPASAQLLFGYEDGETGSPYSGNPAAYVVTPSNVGVTQGLQSIQATVPVPTYGGVLSSQFTDAVLANTINSAPYVLIDMTVPDKVFNWGNIDLAFFQTDIRPGADGDETGWSPTFALSPGQTVTLQIPLTNTQFGSPHITLDPAQPWSYQINMSFSPGDNVTGPYVFQFDNLRAVPEPATWGLLTLGAVVLGVVRRRRS